MIVRYCKIALLCCLTALCLPTVLVAGVRDRVIVYPAPAGEKLNGSYSVSAGGKIVSVYEARVGAADETRRFKAVDDLLNSDKYFDVSAFAYFDLSGSATVHVSVKQTINKVRILPTNAHVVFSVNKNKLTFLVAKPQNLTIEINGEEVKSLHLFVNPIDKLIPSPNDPNVIFFGPGIHEVSNLLIGSNKTVYVAGGAVVRCVVGRNEKYGIEPSGLRNYAPRFFIQGTHIKICGHGIIDAGLCPIHAGNLIFIKGDDITLESVIIRNSCGWTIPVRQSNNVLITNVKILGYRANTDGIDICNSRNVIVDGCFLRTNDDLIVIKTEKGEGLANHIIIKNCVLWNPIAHALSIGSELRESVSDVLFTNCDIIHDRGREWSLRVFQSDSSLVNNVRFENLRIEESRRLISLWIDKNISSDNAQLGHIQNVKFTNIKVYGIPLSIEIHGGDMAHKITNIYFHHVYLNGHPLTLPAIERNSFYTNLIVD